MTRSEFLLFIIQAFNYLYDLYMQISKWSTKIYNSLYDTVTGLNGKWAFVSSYYTPIPITSIDKHYSPNITWFYNESDNSLTYNSVGNKLIKIPWLSTKIVSINKHSSVKREYNLDSFIESLQINTIPISAPSLYLIIMTWSINSRVWFTDEESLCLHIIDEMGEDQIFRINDHHIVTNIVRNKLSVHEIADADMDANADANADADMDANADAESTSIDEENNGAQVIYSNPANEATLEEADASLVDS